MIPRYAVPNACMGVGGPTYQVSGRMTGVYGSGFYKLSVLFPLQTNVSFSSLRRWWDAPALILRACLSTDVWCASFLLHFSNPATDPGHYFALCGMAGATGFEVLSINLALANSQRKEGGVVKAPHWVAGDLSSALLSATKKKEKKNNNAVDLGHISYTFCSTTASPSVKCEWFLPTWLKTENLTTGTRGT